LSKKESKPKLKTITISEAMASQANINEINQLLDPHLFQVVGSTPKSVRDSLKLSQLKDNPTDAAKFVTVAIFAAAVNKATMETFLASKPMQDIRATINTSFNIQGKPNMTAITLIGHCLLTTDIASKIKFAVEFRKKMGQDHIWDGNLDRGSVSELQKKIFMERKRVTDEAEAKLLGSCLLKWSGIDRSPMSMNEASFWGVPGSAGASSQPRASATPSRSSPPAPPSPPDFRPQFSTHNLPSEMITLSDGTIAEISGDALLYYRTVISPDPERLIASIEKRGAEAFIEQNRRQLAADPTMSKRPSGTVIT